MEFERSNRPLPPVIVPDSEVRVALDNWVGVRLTKVLPALAAIYLWTAAVRLFTGPSHGSPGLDWLAYATGVAILAAWGLLRRGRIEPGRVHLFASAIGALILIRSLAVFSKTSDTTQVFVILLLLLGSANTLLAWRGFAYMAILGVAGWIALASQKLPLTAVICWSLILIPGMAVSLFGIHRRLAKYSGLQKARLTEEAQKRDEKLAEKNSRERFKVAIQATEDGLWYWDLKSEVFEYSASWAEMLGFGKGELDTNVDEWFSRVHPGYLTEMSNELSAHLHGESVQFRNEHRLLRKDGSYIWVLARGTAVRNDAGEAVALAGSHADITSLIEAENRLLKDSFEDKLTNLANRDYMLGCLEKKIERQKAGASNAQHFAVIFLDLDGFKVINDSLGHPVGDELLAAVAGRLRNCARPADVVARFGGDEFVILLDRIRDAEEALVVGNRMRSALATPFQIGGRDVVSGASIGIVLSSPEIDNTDDLLRYADIAMYRAKSGGKGQVQLFNNGMRSYATKLCDLQNDLRQALSRQQFVLHYQPTFSITTGKILGVEALIRWQRSESELVLPTDFIPLAEETGLISEIGEWALQSACQQNVAWQRAGIPPVSMAVNLSPRQLQQKDFPDTVARILKETNLPVNLLQLELTETALMDSLDRVSPAIERLCAQGVRIAIDDFGVGHSSLNYLRQFDFHTLKMDRCFLSDVATNGKAAAIAKGVITLAHNLDLSVIAEGVEHNAQLAFLAAHRCDQAQGFLAGQPVCAERLVDMLRLGDVRQAFNYAGFEPASELHRLAYHAGNRGDDLESDLRPAPERCTEIVQQTA
jgi:diguanylate cyclase (GGDEF)-like protein/PAS domain S-box-containing protein